MSDTHRSSSIEQAQAEEEIFASLQQIFGITLEKNKKLPLTDNPQTHIQPDFFSAEHHIIGEIFAHIGKPKKAQDNKIANDILKMLTYERATGVACEKILVVCDEQEYEKLNGASALAESIRQFDIRILLVPISEELREQILQAQSRQRMVNA